MAPYSIFFCIVLICLSNAITAFVIPYSKPRVCSPGLRPAIFGNFFGAEEKKSEAEAVATQESPSPAVAVEEEKSSVSAEEKVPESLEPEATIAEASDATAEVAVKEEENASDDKPEEIKSEDSDEADSSVAVEEKASNEVVATTDEDAEKKPKKKTLRTRHTCFVGNLPFESKEAEIQEMFAEYGEVVMVSIPRNRETGQARGFAFVDLGSDEDVQAAVEALDGAPFGGRTLRVTKSLSKEEAQKQSRKTDKGKKKLYVGNLPFDASKEDIIDFYSEYGEVYDLYVPINVNTGLPRGFAFLSMDDENAEKAIEATNGVEFMGRKLVVSIPLPPGEKSKRRQNSERTKLYVGNLSFYTIAETLRELFEEFGTVYDCYMPVDDQERPRGFGFVTMDPDAAMSAVDEVNGCEIDGRIIRVNEAQPRINRRDDDFDEED